MGRSQAGVLRMDLKEACGSQGSQESSSLQPSSWQAFAHSSTLHGLRFIFPYGQPSARSLLWAVALLACLGLLALESAERLAYFLSYPHVTSVDAVVSGSLVFPVVTICNLNAYRFSRLTRNDLYHAGELLALLDVDLSIPQPHLADPDVLAFLQERANFSANRPKSFCMKEFTERVGHDLREMMLYCRFQGQECNHSDFKAVSPAPALRFEPPPLVRDQRRRSAPRLSEGACQVPDLHVLGLQASPRWWIGPRE